MSLPIVDSVADAFERFHHRRPSYLSIAPGRVNLIGEHTDYNGGLVLPFAIDRTLAIAAAVTDAGSSTVHSLALERSVTTTLAEPRPHAERWPNGLLGVAAQYGQAGATIPEMDIVIDSTIPIGSGLSSSAAVEAAAARLFDSVSGSVTPAIEAARRCRRAEHEFVGTPCGIMDMLTALAGVEQHALLIDCAAEVIEPVPMPSEEEAVIVVMQTGVTHDLATSDYADRRETCATAAAVLGIEHLAHASIEALVAANLTEVQRHRALHVVTEQKRTKMAADALRRGDLERLGRLMSESHHSLRDEYEVSCPELDCLVEASWEVGREGGVLGARMTGAGFGGCAIALCRPDAVDRLRDEVQQAYESHFGRTAEIWLARSVASARAWRIDDDTIR